MEELFRLLSHAVEGAPPAALTAALVWGVLSVILSPCHLASIPLIVGIIAGQRELTARRAFLTATVFSLGMLVTIGVLGVATALLGRMLGDIGAYGNYVVAAIFFLVGLYLLEVLSLPFSGPGRLHPARQGMPGAFSLGLLFGMALGPCTFAYMAPVLGVTFRVGAAAPLYAAGLLLAYGIGHCGVIAAAGASTEAVQRYLNWNESSRGMRVVKQVCGALVLCGGLYLIYTA